MLYGAKDKFVEIHDTQITLALYCWQQPEWCAGPVFFVCYQSHFIFGIHSQDSSRDV